MKSGGFQFCRARKWSGINERRESMKFLNWFRRTLRNIGINTPGFTEYFAFGGGMSTAAGVRVTEGNALLISTVYQCVRVIAETVASLPVFLYQRTPAGKKRALDHDVYRV